MEVPSLVKLSMVTAFDQARVEIKVKDVLISRCITEEDSAKVVAVQLASTVTVRLTQTLDPNSLR